MIFSSENSGKLSAIAWLRWRIFVNTLRSLHGKIELLSRILISIAFTGLGMGGALLMGVLSYIVLMHGKVQLLAVFLWIIFFFWQFFPVMAAAFTSNTDSSDLLRFPLSYGSYFLVRMAYGIFDPASAISCLWAFGFLMGVTFAKPILFPWALVVLISFAAFNLLFMQMIFAWVERWLAQRRTREILGILFILFTLSFQLIGPLSGRYGRQARPEMQKLAEVIAPVQALLPPGLAADAIVEGIYPQWPIAFSSFVLLSAFAMVIAYGLHIRLLAQFRGENLNESAAASALPANRELHLGWNLPGLTTPVAAVFEKEVRYLMRSAPMLLTLIMPIFALLVFRFGAMNSARHSFGFLSHASEFAFPFAAAYMLMMLTNVVYNCFGGDAAGIQFFYASPVAFRDIALGKNITYAGILFFEMILGWGAVALLYGPPALLITIATIVGMLFAAPLNFAVGNVLSIYSPKRIDYSKFGSQRASQMTALIGVLLQLVVVGLGISIFSITSYFENAWAGIVLLLVLAGPSFIVYEMILRRMDRLALERRDTLIAELCKA
jgi:ABC-2 type transport system permease protein